MRPNLTQSAITLHFPLGGEAIAEEPLRDEGRFIPDSNLITVAAKSISYAITATDSINLSAFSEFPSVLSLTLHFLLSLLLSAASSTAHTLALGCSTGNRLQLLSSGHTSFAAHYLSGSFSLFTLSVEDKKVAAGLSAADFLSSPAVERILNKVDSAA